MRPPKTQSALHLLSVSRIAMALRREFISARELRDQWREHPRCHSRSPPLRFSGSHAWRLPEELYIPAAQPEAEGSGTAGSQGSIPAAQAAPTEVASIRVTPPGLEALPVHVSPTLPMGIIPLPTPPTPPLEPSMVSLLSDMIKQQQDTNRILMQTAEASLAQAQTTLQVQAVTAQATAATATAAGAAQPVPLPQQQQQQPAAKPRISHKRDWDPAVRCIFDSFQKEAKKRMEALRTHTELQRKYAQEGFMHAKFTAEKRMTWPLPKSYNEVAFAVSEVEDEDPDYDLDAAFAQLRRKHAEECWKWVKTHQERCAEHLAELVTEDSLLSFISDQLEEWALSHRPDAETMRFHQEEANILVQRWLRIELPNMQSRMKKEQEKKEKRQEALLEAEVRYRTAGTGALIAEATLELANSRSKVAGKHVLPEGGVFAHLLKDVTEDNKKSLPVVFKGQDNAPAGKAKTRTGRSGKGRGKGQRAESQGRSNSRGRGSRSNSRKNTPRRQQQQPQPHPKSILKPRSRSNSRVCFQGKGKGRVKGKGRRSSKSSAKRKGQGQQQNRQLLSKN